MKAITYDEASLGMKVQIEEIPSELAAAAEEARAELVEQVAEKDEEVLEAYLDELESVLAEAESPVSFALSLARKDVGLALDVAEGLGIVLPQTRLNHDQLAAAVGAGMGDRDMAAMLAYQRRGGR